MSELSGFFVVVGIAVTFAGAVVILWLLAGMVRHAWRQHKAERALIVGIDRAGRFGRAWLVATPDEKAEHLRWCERVEAREKGRKGEA